MKKIIFLLLLISPMIAIGQGTSPLGSPNNVTWNKGYIQVDSGITIMPSDTTEWFGRHSDFKRLASTLELYYWDGYKYVPFGSGGGGEKTKLAVEQFNGASTYTLQNVPDTLSMTVTINGVEALSSWLIRITSNTFSILPPFYSIDPSDIIRFKYTY